MADERDPIEQWLDAALYGPVGLLLELRDRLPELAERGRNHLQAQMSMARVVGQFAVQIGSRRVAKYLQNERAPQADEAPHTPTRPPAEELGPVAPRELPVAEPIDVGGLPIPGYDTLAASQVVARLDGLDGDELEAVRAYEAAHRNRKTVLGKVAQRLRSA